MAQPGISWDTLAPFLVWQFLIPLTAGWAQTILYSIFIRAGDPKPQPGMPRYIKHRRQILIATYFFYFLFTIYEADHNLQRLSHVYNDLGVPIDVAESGINSRFRKLTMRFHPDKLGPIADREAANNYYVHLTQAREIVVDPVKRFAYDRFGPEIFAQCPKCLTIKEYMDIAMVGAFTSYGALLVMLAGSNALGYFRDGAYWRYLGLLTMATFEMRTVMRPDYPVFLAKYLNPLLVATNVRPGYLPFQILSIVKRTAISLTQFLGLLMPLYRENIQVTDDTDDTRHKQLDRLSAIVAEVNKDLSRQLEFESVPFRDNETAKSELREALKNYMMQNAIHQERQVNDAMGQAIARRRMGAPHGARGTK